MPDTDSEGGTSRIGLGSHRFLKAKNPVIWDRGVDSHCCVPKAITWTKNLARCVIHKNRG